MLSPAQLPEVVAVQIINVSRLCPDRVSEYVTSCSESPCVTLTGAEAERVAKLWRSLPQGEQARCHTPPFVLRFKLRNAADYAEGRWVSVSMCWQCDNMYGLWEDQRISFQFDGRCPAAMKLLATCKRHSK